MHTVPPRHEGRTRRHEREAGCDGRERIVRRAMRVRTAKSCGPGTPGLVLSAQGDHLRTTVTNKVMDTGESTKISR